VVLFQKENERKWTINECERDRLTVIKKCQIQVESDVDRVYITKKKRYNTRLLVTERRTRKLEKKVEKEMRHLHSWNWRVGTWKEQVIENWFFYIGQLVSSIIDEYKTNARSQSWKLQKKYECLFAPVFYLSMCLIFVPKSWMYKLDSEIIVT